jgi:hypothetical protein
MPASGPALDASPSRHGPAQLRRAQPRTRSGHQRSGGAGVDPSSAMRTGLSRVNRSQTGRAGPPADGRRIGGYVAGMPDGRHPRYGEHGLWLHWALRSGADSRRCRQPETGADSLRAAEQPVRSGHAARGAAPPGSWGSPLPCGQAALGSPRLGPPTMRSRRGDPAGAGPPGYTTLMWSAKGGDRVVRNAGTARGTSRRRAGLLY